MEKELNHFQQAEVIQSINYSLWVAPIVILKKANSKVHLCADFSTELNVLDTHQHLLPVPEDLFTKLIGGTCFTKIDVPDAYLPMEVDEEFKNLLTINTHNSLIQFKCFSFGIKIALAIFQQTIDAMLKGMTGVTAYINDIIVTGTTQEALLQCLICVLDQIQ